MALTPTQLKRLRHMTAEPNGNRVAAAIQLSGEKQGDVADALAFTQSYVSNVARGRFNGITVENARKFADHFGCAIEDLFPERSAVAS